MDRFHATAHLLAFAPHPQVVEDTMHNMTQGIETAVKAGFDVQQALVESSVSVMRASFAVNKIAVEQLLALSKQRQRQPGLISALENNLQTWAGVVERTVAATEVAVDRATADTERMAKEAETERERGQWEQELEESRERGERQQRKRAYEPQTPAPQAAEIPAINVVKREDDWAVVRDNASRPSATFDTKREAIKRARELAQRNGADVHVEKATSTHPERNGAGGARQHEGGAAKA